MCMMVGGFYSQNISNVGEDFVNSVALDGAFVGDIQSESC